MSAANLGPFALARQGGGDPELFALIDQYRRLAARAEGISDQAFKLQAEHGIEDLRRFQVGEIVSETDVCYWPEEAIEALRDIAAREGGQ